jgi:hypothetical protein
VDAAAAPSVRLRQAKAVLLTRDQIAKSYYKYYKKNDCLLFHPLCVDFTQVNQLLSLITIEKNNIFIEIHFTSFNYCALGRACGLRQSGCPSFPHFGVHDY